MCIINYVKFMRIFSNFIKCFFVSQSVYYIQYIRFENVAFEGIKYEIS